RDAKGQKRAYLRLYDGTIRRRDRVLVRGDVERKVTALTPADVLTAGHIGALIGLGDVRIGDSIGVPRCRSTSTAHHFAPPTLETVVLAARPADRGRLHVALEQLAEQDPLINLRHDDV